MKNIFIVNKASQTGRAAETWKKVEEYLNQNQIDYQVNFTAGAGDATNFAKEATEKGEEVTLFVMGGDGTLNEALNGIVDFENTVYCPLPSGSANDFVKGIGFEGDALEILKRAFDKKNIRRLDIGQITYDGGSRRFGVSAGIGVDAYVCLQALDSKLKKFLNRFGAGQATYGLLTVGDIFTMPLSDAVIKTEEKELKLHNVIFAAAMNCKAEGGGIPMVPYATPDSGHLTAFVAHDIARMKCLSLLPSLVAGKHMGKSGFDFIDFNTMNIEMDKPMCVHADGEHVGFLKNVEFSCKKSVLRVVGF